MFLKKLNKKPLAAQNYQIQHPSTNTPSRFTLKQPIEQRTKQKIKTIIMYKISMLWYIVEIVPDRSEIIKLGS
jgi:hypothetical protein